MSDTASISSRFSALRIAKQKKQEADDLLRMRGIERGDTIMAAKPDVDVPRRVTMKQDAKVRTNMYSVRFADNEPVRIYRYDVDIKLARGDGDATHAVELTRRTASDVLFVDRKQRCDLAFDIVVGNNPNIFPPREECIYDQQAILYTFKKLEINENVDRHILEPLDLTGTEKLRIMFFPFTRIICSLKRVERFNLVLDKETIASSINSDLQEQSADLQQFMEIATSQQVLIENDVHVTFQSGRSYLLAPENYGFRREDTPDLGRGAYLAVGAHKSAKIVEGPTRGDPRLVITVETKKTPFHSVQLLLDKILKTFPSFIEHHKQLLFQAQNLVKGLFVMLTYTSDSASPIKVKGLQSSAREQTFELDGRQITVEAYYQERYPDVPLVVGRGRNDANFYPLELCEVCDNQRLTSAQLTPDQTGAVIRSCAVPPIDQIRQTVANARALNMNVGALAKVGNVNVAAPENPISMVCPVLEAPKMKYSGGSQCNFEPARAAWRPSGEQQYYLPAKVGTWALYSLSKNCNESQVKQFCESFVQRCKRMGMGMERPAEMYRLESSEKLEDRIDRAHRAGCNFIVILSDLQDTNIHDALKTFEHKYDIVTQNITARVALDSIGANPKRLSLENVVHKTNIKNGGLNYMILTPGTGLPLGESDLFIGFGMNHPGGITMGEEGRLGGTPSVVGYSANDLEHPCAFSGDFIFQESRRDEKVTIVEGIVKLCAERYLKNRDSKPKRIFLYRNGCSEGQFPLVLQYEIPLMKATLKDMGMDIPMTVIVPNRMHDMRFVPIQPRGQKPWEQNLPPGVAVDRVVTHPKFFEFYLGAHQARQGTAKFPRYTVLFDENNLSMEAAESITYSLCFDHQIITGTTSLPTPAYIANRYADRGRRLYTEYMRHRGREMAHPQLDDLNDNLTYNRKQIRDKRFNA